MADWQSQESTIVSPSTATAPEWHSSATSSGVRRLSKLGDAGVLLTGMFAVIVLQGLLELVTFAQPAQVYGAVGFGQRVVRLGLYIYLFVSLFWLATHRDGALKLAPRRMNLLTLAYVELLGAVIIGMLHTGERSASAFEETRLLIELMILVPVVYASVKSADQMRRAIDRFITLLIPVAVLNLVGYVGQFFLPAQLPSFATLFPLVLLFGCVMSWTRVLLWGPSRKRVIQWMILWAGALITFHKPIMATGLVGLAVPLVVLVFRSARRMPGGFQSPLNRTRIISTALLICVLVAIILTTGNAVTSGRLFDMYRYNFDRLYLKLYYPDVGLDGNRLMIWQDAWDRVLQNPWVGIGWGFRADVYYQEDVYIHNLFLYWLGSVGFIGGAALLFSFFVAGRYVLKHLNLSVDTDLKVGLLGYAAIVLLFNGIGMMFAEPAFVYLVGIVAALILRMATLDASMPISAVVRHES